MGQGSKASAAGPAASGMSLASAGLSAYGDYLSSSGEAAGEKFKASLLEDAAVHGRLKAEQVNAQMARNLTITLGHVDAVRAAAHTDPTSPTGAAVRGEMEAQLGMKKEITVENIMQQARMDEAQAAYERSAASNALLAGDIAMGADVAKGLSGLMMPA
jgi:hypothetical protein